eukprot:450792_1
MNSLLLIITVFIFNTTAEENTNICFGLIKGQNTTRVNQGRISFSIFYNNNTFTDLNLKDKSVVTSYGTYSVASDLNDSICYLQRIERDSNGLPKLKCETLKPTEFKSVSIDALEGCINTNNCSSSCYSEDNTKNRDVVAYYLNGIINQNN